MEKNTKIDKNGKNVSKLINMIPGALVYSGNKTEKFKIERFSFDKESILHEFYESCSIDFINSVKTEDQSKIQWINVTGIDNVKEVHRLGNLFNIDNMILEQVLNITKHSMHKVTDTYIFNDIQMIMTKAGKVLGENISFYFSHNTILTFQERRGDVFDSLRERIKNGNGQIRNSNAEYTYFCMLDALVDHYIDTVDNMKIDIEKMEIDLMEDQSLNHQLLHNLRKQNVLIRISGTPIEKIIFDLLKSQNEGILVNKEYFESVYQHIRIVNNENMLQKESVDSLYENYMMTNANDMNHVMTILTIFSAIFIPLSFLAGVFGMNFKYMPSLDDPSGFYYFIFGCFITALLMIIYFKKREWF